MSTQKYFIYHPLRFPIFNFKQYGLLHPLTPLSHFIDVIFFLNQIEANNIEQEGKLKSILHFCYTLNTNPNYPHFFSLFFSFIPNSQPSKLGTQKHLRFLEKNPTRFNMKKGKQKEAKFFGSKSISLYLTYSLSSPFFYLIELKSFMTGLQFSIADKKIV